MDSLDLDAAQGEGWVACNNGEPIESNPYIKGHFLYDAWNEGWYDCFEWNSKVDGFSSTDFGAEHLLCLLLSIVVIIVALAYFID